MLACLFGCITSAAQHLATDKLFSLVLGHFNRGSYISTNGMLLSIVSFIGDDIRVALESLKALYCLPRTCVCCRGAIAFDCSNHDGVDGSVTTAVEKPNEKQTKSSGEGLWLILRFMLAFTHQTVRMLLTAMSDNSHDERLVGLDRLHNLLNGAEVHVREELGVVALHLLLVELELARRYTQLEFGEGHRLHRLFALKGSLYGGHADELNLEVG
jgi:hypothetical protein